MTLSDILHRLEGVKKVGGGYMAKCPCHADNTPSLSVKEENGKLLIHCFGGCSYSDILTELGFQREPVAGGQNRTTVLEAEYLYADGALKKVKYRRADGSKYCVWYSRQVDGWVKGRKGIAPGLYQSQAELPCLSFLVEGEKDVDNLKAAGMPAVSLPDGSQSKWDKSYSQAFEGKQVAIVPDNDEPGQKYAKMCAKNLHGVASAIWILDLKQVWKDVPDKGDVSDLISRFGADDAVQKVLNALDTAPQWEPQAEAEDKEEAKPQIVVTSAVDLQNADLPPTVFMITGLLPEGTSIISAASKIGKSWMVLDMGLCIAAGEPFMNKPTVKCGVLYLALEDSLTGRSGGDDAHAMGTGQPVGVQAGEQMGVCLC